MNLAEGLYWGDTHLHTTYSTDAGMIGYRLGSDEGTVSFTRVLRENARRRQFLRRSSHGIPPHHSCHSEPSHCSARDQMTLDVECVVDSSVG